MTSPIDTQTIHFTWDRRKDLSKSAEEPASIDNHVRCRLAECEFAYYLGEVTWRFEHGTLTLNGRVATFALKHSLESLFRHVETVEQVVNDVQVVSSTGLSSVRGAVLAGDCPSV